MNIVFNTDLMDRLNMLAEEMKQAVNAAWGIYVAMTEGDSSPDEYTDGLCCVVELMGKKTKELEGLAQSIFNEAVLVNAGGELA